MRNTVVGTILEFSDKIKDGRTEADIMLSAMEEMGELSLEIKINNGLSYKTEGIDGIVGEAIDVINCMVDLILTHTGNITEEQLQVITENKCKKWLEKSKLINK